MGEQLETKKRKAREPFGTLGKKGNLYYPSYVGPDKKRYTSPNSFRTVTDARAWLMSQRGAIEAGEWKTTTPRQVKGRFVPERKKQREFFEYAEAYLTGRKTAKGLPLAKKTMLNYKWHVSDTLKSFHGKVISYISKEEVDAWWDDLVREPDDGATPKFTKYSQAYVLLRGIMNHALENRVIAENPVNIAGAANLRTGKAVRVPTDLEVEKVMAKLAPDFRALFLTEAWGQLRFGEVTELKLGDLTTTHYQDHDGKLLPEIRISVRRGVVHIPGEDPHVGDPKSSAGKRDVVLPPLPSLALAEHIESDTHTPFTADSLLWPSVTNPKRHLSYAVYWSRWSAALEAANVPYFNPHALRHYGATALARSGATLKDLMEQLGHAGPKAAMRYQASAAARRADLIRDAAGSASTQASKERQVEELKRQQEELKARQAKEQAELEARMKSLLA